MTIRKHNRNPGDNWQAVSNEHPCPVCDGPDNCKVSGNGEAAWCGRVPTDKQNDGGQYFHKLNASQKRRVRNQRKRQRQTTSNPETDWQKKAAEFASKAQMQCRKLAKQIGVSVDALDRLQVGWDRSESAWTFPERDAVGRVIGICRRLSNGDKRTIRGGQRGLTFDPEEPPKDGPILIVEGGTDTAAGLTMGFATIGRPSARGGIAHLAELLAAISADRQVIVLGENDEKENGDWPGRDGAIAIATKLAERLDRPIEWALPPDDAKDLRVWFADLGEKPDAFLDRLTTSTVEPTDSSSSSGSHASQLVELVLDSGVELFHSPDAGLFATTSVGNHKETYRLRSDTFQTWLGRLSWEQTRKAISSQVLEQAIGTLGGIAKYEGNEFPTFVRLAGFEGDIWVDLADDEWRAVRVTADKWEVVANPPVRFVRSNGMRSLPVPIHGGNLAELREFLNVETDADWILLQAWLIGCFRPTGPFPLLALHGEQGSAKSTTSRLLRELIDPNVSPVRSLPSELRDMMIAATNSRLLAFDNLSSIREPMSDALCRLSTGGGFAIRELYTNDGEAIFDVQRPVLLNGITELAKRSDLLDRTIAVTLPSISETRRKTETELWDEFNAARPRILGAILAAVSTAIRNEAGVKLARKPRMADFARWSVAAESSLDCSSGDFIAAYSANRTLASETAISASVIGEPLLNLLEEIKRFEGSATDLLKKLNGKRAIRQPPGWPRQPNSLSAQLSRLMPNLRDHGWKVEMGKRDPKSRTKIIRIDRVEPKTPLKAKRRKPTN